MGGAGRAEALNFQRESPEIEGIQKLKITRRGSNDRGVGLSTQSNISIHF